MLGSARGQGGTSGSSSWRSFWPLGSVQGLAPPGSGAPVRDGGGAGVFVPAVRRRGGRLARPHGRGSEPPGPADPAPPTKSNGGGLAAVPGRGEGASPGGGRPAGPAAAAPAGRPARRSGVTPGGEGGPRGRPAEGPRGPRAPEAKPGRRGQPRPRCASGGGGDGAARRCGRRVPLPFSGRGGRAWSGTKGGQGLGCGSGGSPSCAE